MNRLPSLYLSHGAPTLPIDPTLPSGAFTELGAELPRPRAVLMLSAHWLTQQPVVSTAERPDTIHDFYGFPRALYEIRYPAPGAPDVAAHAAALLRSAGIETAATPHGLDHGAWVPMLLMFPHADVPVAQLSIQPRADAAHHFRVGRALRPLRDEGVMVIGSGQITHNLRAADFSAPPDDVALMHPTDEHLLPVFAALGAADDDYRLRIRSLGTYQRMLAMTNYVFDSAA
ncbi:DODA-type extradiol aromatic ring-opening family dioxygenase [Burkholderia pseudomallei]|uniref:DODA-type extradiol aromatic ring-opening family dioxygenase n=1 Tax=Burkholderia pseudomallei TaxID=28450 RepID=UPI000CDD8C4E|nr:class III extradiol ring-cleavage dioxygenase [Burkholderia pseudomallei]